MTPLKNGQPREEDRHMWVCGRSPHTHICPSPLLEGSFFSALIHLIEICKAVDWYIVLL